MVKILLKKTAPEHNLYSLFAPVALTLKVTNEIDIML